MSSTISIKLTNASTQQSKNLRLAKAALSSTTVYSCIYETPNVQASNITDFPPEIQAEVDSSALEVQLVLQNVTTMEQLAVLTVEEMKSFSVEQLFQGGCDEHLSLLIQCAKEDSSAPKLSSINGSDVGSKQSEIVATSASSSDPTPVMTPSPVLEAPSSSSSSSSSSAVGGSLRIKVTNSVTGKFKNVRIMVATVRSASTYDWLYHHEGLQMINLMEFPVEQQAVLDAKTHELRAILSSGGNDTIFSAKQLRSQTLLEILQSMPNSNSPAIAMSLQVVDVTREEKEPISTPAVTSHPPLFAPRTSTIGGSLRIKVSNSITGRSKNVRIMVATAGSTSTYEWLYNHEGLKMVNLMEFPEEQQSSLDQTTQEVQATMNAGGDDAIYSAKQLRCQTLLEILQSMPNSNSATITMSIQVVDANSETAATPDSALAAKGSSSANHGGFLKLEVTNALTRKSKIVRVMPSTLSVATSGYDWLYQHEGLKEAKVLEFPEEQQTAMDSKAQEIQISMTADGTNEKVCSVEELHFQTLPQILDPIFEQLLDPKTLISVSIHVVDVKSSEEVEEDGAKEAEEDELSEEANEAARLKKKQEEEAFWAAEEAKMLAQAEERKKQKEAKLQAALKAEQAAKEAAQKQAAEKEAAIKAEEEERLAKREAQKQAALQAEQDARKQAEEERQEQEQTEEKIQEQEVQELQSRRKRTSLISERLAGRSAIGLPDISSTNLGQKTTLEEDEMDISMDDLLAAEEEERLNNQTKAEISEQSDQASTAILEVDEVGELLRMEEIKRLEEEKANPPEEEEEDAAGDTRGVIDEAPDTLSRDIIPAMDSGESCNEHDDNDSQDSAPEQEGTLELSAEEAAAQRDNIDQLERFLESKEIEYERENERMLALESKAAKMEEDARFAPVDTPRDRTVKMDAPKKRKGGVEGRLRKVEQSFVADPARKRSADVVPLSVEFNSFLRKLRNVVKQVKVYQVVRQQQEATRTKMVDDLSKLSESTPLHDFVGKKADLSQVEGVTARKAAEAAKAQGVRSYKSIEQLVELQGKVSEEEYQEEIVKYLVAWDEAVSTRVNKAMILHKKLEQDVLHYENKVAKLRSKAHDMESKGKFLSSQQSARLNRNEMKLNDAWQIHELECSSICNLLEEITVHGWCDLLPLVKSSLEWEIRRMEREISTIGLGLPGILKILGDTISDLPLTEESRIHLRTEIEAQRNVNRDLERKVNQLQAALNGSWTTKTEFQKVLQNKNIVL